ncbi:MAG: flavodoxin [Candidatus Omnitrophica bacterium]|nr:flavodoxin [Candidatus Omnitrophota bacterium]
MKALITYYSYSGNTDKVVKIFADVIRQKGEVDVQRLKPVNEIEDFGGQCRAAFTKKRAELKEGVNYDASHYDLILLGSPVWAFAPTPALNTYLDKISGLNGKKAILLLTSGSGLGVKRCFNNIKTVLQNKGVTDISEINIPDRKLKDETFIASAIKKVVG